MPRKVKIRRTGKTSKGSATVGTSYANHVKYGKSLSKRKPKIRKVF